MKPILNNAYGYKICYTEKPFKNKYVTKYRVHSYKRAVLMKKSFVDHVDRKRKKRTWHVIPITRREVKRGIWKCPF